MKNGALFRSAKDIAYISIMSALLIAAQLALNMVAGVEIVTVLFLSYCYSFGVRRGLVVATVFSLLRCMVFGFAPNVIILYLVYYNLFALVFGMLGKFAQNGPPLLRLALVIVCAAAMTCAFTLLDDVITPLFYGYSARAALVYFYNSLVVMGVQVISTVVSVALLFVPLRKAFSALTGAQTEK